MFYAIAGPAAGLFGPTQKACAELAVERDQRQGRHPRPAGQLLFANGDGPVAEATKSAVRLMLEEKVDFFLGSHNSAVREALVATIKGKVPYVYTPIYEGGECCANTYVLADTPQQQMETALPWLAKKTRRQDGVPHRQRLRLAADHQQARQAHHRQAAGGKVIGEEYVPLGAPNKFEEAVTRIKGAKPELVLITLVGADNVNFNRTFAGFGLDKDITRLSSLLEENTLLGIGAESSKGLYGCMSYYANIDTPENRAFKAAYKAKYGEKAPVLSLLGADCYAGVKFIEAVVDEGQGHPGRQGRGRRQRPHLRHAHRAA